jgi:hypothetical protein
MAGDAIAAMPAARRWARAEVAAAVRAVTAPLAEVTALPGEVTLLAGAVALVPGAVALVPGAVVVVPGEAVVVPGEVPVPPGGVVPVPPVDGATAWPVFSTGVRAEVTGVVMPLTVLVAVVTTAPPALST